MSHPVLTVLMSVYNGEKFLEESIKSILNQTFENFEFLIYDDGSTDNSVRIINNCKDKRIHLVQNKQNRGLAANLNKGIKRARGKYIARMDDDDISLPNRLEEQYKFMESNRDIAVSGTWVKFIGKKINTLEDNVLKNPANPEMIRCCFLFNSVLKHPTVIFRKEVLDSEGYFYDEAFNRAEDYELWIRISKKHLLSNLERVLLHYRVHPDSVSRMHTEENIRQSNQIRKAQLLELGIQPSPVEMKMHFEISRLFQKEFPSHFFDAANRWLKKIYDSNRMKKIYDDETLLDMLADRWRNTIKKHIVIEKNANDIL